MLFVLLGDEGQQSDLTGALDGLGQLALMHGAGTGGAARQDLGALGDEAAQLGGVLIVDILALVNAELAHLFALAVRPPARGALFSRSIAMDDSSLSELGLSYPH